MSQETHICQHFTPESRVTPQTHISWQGPCPYVRLSALLHLRLSIRPWFSIHPSVCPFCSSKKRPAWCSPVCRFVLLFFLSFVCFLYRPVFPYIPLFVVCLTWMERKVPTAVIRKWSPDITWVFVRFVKSSCLFQHSYAYSGDVSGCNILEVDICGKNPTIVDAYPYTGWVDHRIGTYINMDTHVYSKHGKSLLP